MRGSRSRVFILEVSKNALPVVEHDIFVGILTTHDILACTIRAEVNARE